MLRNELSSAFLAALPQDCYEALAPHLRTISFEPRLVFFDVGEPIESVLFPHSGMISIVIPMASGEQIEAGTVSRRGVVSGGSLFTDMAVSQALAQVAGEGSMMPRSIFRDVAFKYEALAKMVDRHDQFMYVQAQQAAGCNAVHDVEERMARWLLQTRDQLETDMLPLTQEFLATMLGVKRTSVTAVARQLQASNLISYRRGRIAIKDLEGLQDTACECYYAVKNHHDRLLRFATPNA
jgi:CRP-like cAMP-binding protein